MPTWPNWARCITRSRLGLPSLCVGRCLLRVQHAGCGTTDCVSLVKRASRALTCWWGEKVVIFLLICNPQVAARNTAMPFDSTSLFGPFPQPPYLRIATDIIVVIATQFLFFSIGWVFFYRKLFSDYEVRHWDRAVPFLSNFYRILLNV